MVVGAKKFGVVSYVIVRWGGGCLRYSPPVKIFGYTVQCLNCTADRLNLHCLYNTLFSIFEKTLNHLKIKDRT